MPKLIPGLRHQIIESARDLLFAGGYENLSIRKIAVSCDISVGTIYNYFPTKNAILKAVFRTLVSRFFRRTAELNHSLLPLADKLKIIFADFKNVSAEFDDFWLKHIESELLAKVVKRKKSSRFFSAFTTLIQEIITNDQRVSSYCNNTNLPTKAVASFIVVSFLNMIHNNEFQYTDFELLLGRIIGNK